MTASGEDASRVSMLIPHGIAQRSLSRLIVWFEKRIPAHSKVPTTPLIDGAEFPWAATLENSWPKIRAELDVVMAHYGKLPNIQDIATDQYNLSRDDKWKTYFFFAFGEKFDGNCRRCPETAALLEKIPGLETAFFSILGPGKRLRSHRGYYQGVVRYHLALMVPPERSTCAIRVGDEVVHWSEGTGFFFDDTYQHEAWNSSTGIRVVLLLDIARPLSFPYSVLNKFIVRAMARAPHVRNAKARHEAWERGFERVLSQK